MISPPAAEAAGPALASMSIYLLMAVVLAFRPAGLFPAQRLMTRLSAPHGVLLVLAGAAAARDRARTAVLHRPRAAHA